MEAKTVAIIPAFNEARTIANVVSNALRADAIDSVVVVNDGSSDATSLQAEIANDLTDHAKKFAVLEHEHNLGKGQAMDTGYHFAKELGAQCLLFLDADLRSLKPYHIDSLVQPIVAQEATMTIGILERSHLQKAILKQWGALSGQRVLPINAWEQLSDNGKRGFNVEAALNALYRHNGWHRSIKRVALDGVTHVGKREKEPTLVKAANAYLRTYGAAVLTYGRMELNKVR